MPSSRLLGNQELDTLLGFSSPVKELDYLCWGKRRRGRKRGGWPDDKVEDEVSQKVVNTLKLSENVSTIRYRNVYNITSYKSQEKLQKHSLNKIQDGLIPP